MRLTAKEVDIIKDVFRNEIEGHYELKLFGSRTDDSKRGGDIDLLLILPVEKFDRNRSRKYEILNKLYESLGDQKIDIIFSTKELLQKDEFLSSLQLRALESH